MSTRNELLCGLRLIATVIACACMLLSQGCGTVHTLSSDHTFRPLARCQYVCSGTRFDLDVIRDHEPTHHSPGLWKVFPIVDLPFCCVVDTVLLPVTLPIEMLHDLENMF